MTNRSNNFWLHMIGLIGLVVALFSVSATITQVELRNTKPVAVAAPVTCEGEPTGGMRFCDNAELDSTRIDRTPAPVAPVVPASQPVAEAVETLTLDYEAGVNEEIWQAALDAGYVGTPGDGCECLYIPVGTVLNISGGLVLVTSDGLMGCFDWVTSDAECAPSGPVVPAGELLPAPTTSATTSTTAGSTNTSIQEDEAGWNCARNGNRICGPGNSEGATPGCYRDGHLVISWTRFELDQYGNPSNDPLWGQLEAPC